MKVPLYNQQAEKTGEVEVSPKVFGVKAKPAVLAEVARVQQMNSRSGQAHTKTRGQISGGGKKPWRQKGTGRARAGSIRSPIWRGGGITFGPTNARNWHRDLNKKVKQQALRMALSDKLLNGKMVVVENITLETPKTKLMNSLLELFRKNDTGLGKKPLMILPKTDTSLIRSSRNLPGFQSLPANALDTLKILKADSLLVLQGSLGVIEATYSPS